MLWSMHRLDFTDHRRELGENRYVYAVVSRRAGGLSIGINLNPDKVCTWDCRYCQVDRTTPGKGSLVDLEELRAELEDVVRLATEREGTTESKIWQIPPFCTAAPEHRVVKDITIAGDGEPTTCPQFAAVVQTVLGLRGGFSLDDVRLVLLTNGALFQQDRVSNALDQWVENGGEVWGKLDVGSKRAFEEMNWKMGKTRGALTTPAGRHPFARHVDNLEFGARRWGIGLQCMFSQRQGELWQQSLGQDWANVVIRLAQCAGEAGRRLYGVQVLTLARTPADPTLVALAEPDLVSIAALIEGIECPIQVVPSRGSAQPMGVRG